MQKTAIRELRTRILLAGSDALILIAAGLIAAWVRFGATGFDSELSQLLRHPGFILYAVSVQFALATTFDLYRPSSWRTPDYLLARSAAMAITMAISLVLGVYLVEPWRFGRGLLALTLLISVPLQVLLRFLWLRIAARPQARTAILIGDGPIIGALRRELEDRPNPPFQIARHLPAPVNGAKDPLDGIDLHGTDLIIVAHDGG